MRRFTCVHFRPLFFCFYQNTLFVATVTAVAVANNSNINSNRGPPEMMQRNIFPKQALPGQRLPTIESSPHQSLASPDSSTPSTTAGYDTASSGAQIISGSDTIRSGSQRAPHPLKSFSVPAPPPHQNGSIPSGNVQRSSGKKEQFSLINRQNTTNKGLDDVRANIRLPRRTYVNVLRTTGECMDGCFWGPSSLYYKGKDHIFEVPWKGSYSMTLQVFGTAG